MRHLKTYRVFESQGVTLDSKQTEWLDWGAILDSTGFTKPWEHAEGRLASLKAAKL